MESVLSSGNLPKLFNRLRITFVYGRHVANSRMSAKLNHLGIRFKLCHVPYVHCAGSNSIVERHA
jgi:hypothetical protein